MGDRLGIPGAVGFFLCLFFPLRPPFPYLYRHSTPPPCPTRLPPNAPCPPAPRQPRTAPRVPGPQQGPPARAGGLQPALPPPSHHAHAHRIQRGGLGVDGGGLGGRRRRLRREGKREGGDDPGTDGAGPARAGRHPLWAGVSSHGPAPRALVPRSPSHSTGPPGVHNRTGQLAPP